MHCNESGTHAGRRADRATALRELIQGCRPGGRVAIRGCIKVVLKPAA